MPYPIVPELSFEFFPPSSTSASLRLWRAVERLAPLNPKFVSVTYGAGGTTRERTYSAIMTIRDRARLNIAGHLTCVDATRDDVLDVAQKYRSMGVNHIVALRGDPPKGEDAFQQVEGGYGSAVELVRGLSEMGGFDVSVAAYPEKHPEASSLACDIDNLKRKLDAGASRAITQFFFDNADFLRFRDEAAKAGITAPIVPGVLPIENFSKMVSFAGRCHARVPDWMHDAFANARSLEDAELLATSICADQCDDLCREGVEHLHFYTLNNPDLTYDVCRAIGVSPSGISLAASADVA